MEKEELSRFQELSNQFEPDLKGPLVGERTATEALETWTGNHPNYQKKLEAMVKTMSFAYFEQLSQLESSQLVRAEKDRFHAMAVLLDAAGRERDLYEIFLDAVDEIFDAVMAAIAQGSPVDDKLLLSLFNDEYTSESVVTFFRLVTGSWLLQHADEYQAFLPTAVAEYVATTIDTVKAEIDEIGLQGLLDSMIKGSGFGVDVVYMDAGSTEEATVHQKLKSEEGRPTINLFYRPGHYDILYRDQRSRTGAAATN
ncbi:hypothetical protein KEM52_002533 [Ascosphaera acerosa]|nr:hypothetical protein KEM52_002533 [Ascosphaera acerosa]